MRLQRERDVHGRRLCPSSTVRLSATAAAAAAALFSTASAASSSLSTSSIKFPVFFSTVNPCSEIHGRLSKMSSLVQASIKSYLIDVSFAFVLLTHFLEYDAFVGGYNFNGVKRFCTQGSISKNKALVEQLRKYGIIKSDKVAEVMETIDRGLFVPKGNPPYLDSPMPVGYNATISAPHMHATCLELLEQHLQPGMRALDVGSGSGYLTACFAMMVGPEGRAVGVEHIPELVASSIENIQISAAAHLLDAGSLSIHVADRSVEGEERSEA